MMRSKNNPNDLSTTKWWAVIKTNSELGCNPHVLISFAALKLPSALTHASSFERSFLVERVDTKTPLTRETKDGTPAGVPEVSRSFLYEAGKKKALGIFVPPPS